MSIPPLSTTEEGSATRGPAVFCIPLALGFTLAACVSPLADTGAHVRRASAINTKLQYQSGGGGSRYFLRYVITPEGRIQRTENLLIRRDWWDTFTWTRYIKSAGWQTFQADLGKYGVYNWRRKYAVEDYDAGQWSLLLTSGGKGVLSEGYGSGPSASNPKTTLSQLSQSETSGDQLLESALEKLWKHSSIFPQ